MKYFNFVIPIIYPKKIGLLKEKFQRIIMKTNMTEVNLDIESVSPVTLSADWSRVARLLLLASLAAIGSIGNVFMISAVMIEDYLRKRGK